VSGVRLANESYQKVRAVLRVRAWLGARGQDLRARMQSLEGRVCRVARVTVATSALARGGARLFRPGAPVLAEIVVQSGWLSFRSAGRSIGGGSPQVEREVACVRVGPTELEIGQSGTCTGRLPLSQKRELVFVTVFISSSKLALFWSVCNVVLSAILPVWS